MNEHLDALDEYRKTIKHGTAVLHIYPDIGSENPRDMYDHLGVMLYNSSRYILGDEQMDTREMESIIEDAYACLPTYAYIHGGVTMNTEAFRSTWDSGQCGYIYTTLERLTEAGFGSPEHPIPTVETVETWLKQEVAEFDRWLRGEVYGFTYHEEIRVNPRGEINMVNEDSCWGFSYDDWDEMIFGMLEHITLNPVLEEWVRQ